MAFVHKRLIPDVVDVGRALVALRRATASWAEVCPYFECIYELTPAARSATAGNFQAPNPGVGGHSLNRSLA